MSDTTDHLTHDLDVQLRWCDGCADERPFVAPPCEDGHGADCVDLMCVDCGEAIVVGLLSTDHEVHLVAFAA